MTSGRGGVGLSESGSGVVVLRSGEWAGRVLRVGHRGAGASCPHNTRLSFETALAAGVDMVETDVRPCATGEIVLAHDDAIRDTAGCSLPVRTTPLVELRGLDLGQGERVLLLEEFLALVRGRCAVMLDLKGEDFEEELVRVVREAEFPAGQVIIPGGSRRSRDRLREVAPEYALSLSLGGPPADGITDVFMDAIDTPAVTWHHAMLDAGVIECLHQRSKTVYAWTVDRESRMSELLAAGVDGIITNRPEALAPLVEGFSR